MTKRLLVTGYGGFVAGSVLQKANEQWELIAHSRKEVPHLRQDITYSRFDLRDTLQLEQFFDESQPDVVIHAAAHAKIDFCESHDEEAEEINVNVTEQIGRLCQSTGARLIFCSTDTVFSGQQGGYIEEDVPHPVNIYGQTKKRAEEILLKISDNVVIARLALVVGFPMLGTDSSFLTNFIAAGKTGTEMTLPENEIRSPIDIVTLGQALLELANHDFQGVLHLAGNTSLNRLDLAFQLAREFDLPTDFINGANSNAVVGRAPRPDDASLNNRLARQVLQTPMLDLEEALKMMHEQAKSN